MHTKMTHIKHLKNLNIVTDRHMQTVDPDQMPQNVFRPRSDAAENKGMKLI